MTNFFKSTLSISVLILLLASCVPQNKLKYVQTMSESDTLKTFQNSVHKQKTIKPKDELYIKILSYDDKTFQFFNNMDNVTNATNSYISLNLISYTVSDSGTIDFPFAGSIELAGLTLKEAKLKMETSLNDYLSEYSVIIKFINKEITILGEVSRPGHYTIPQDNINIFQAIGLAGDISYYGNRKKVTIIREINSQTTYFEIDLTKKDVVNSPYYYLEPNDIIYVEPLKNIVWGIHNFPFGTVLSAISTSVLILNYINNNK